MSQRTVRQDYIAKIRYQNDLPPPPLVPKLLNYQDTGLVTNSHLLGSLFRKENFRSLIELDEFSGMPIDLLEFPGVLTVGDESALFSRINNDKIQLSPEDRVLLREPGASKISKSDPGVSFLRRTEYISEGRSGNGVNGTTNPVSKKKDDKIDANALLSAVEKTFDLANFTLSGSGMAQLRHPKKKNLKAKRCWSMLPDTSKLDQVFLGIKLVGSASISRIEEEAHKPELQTSIFKPVTLDSGEWMAYYTTNTKTSINLKRKIDNTTKENPEVPITDDSEIFKFKHIRDFDMKFTRFEKAVDEMAIKFDEKSKTAYYVPVGGRIDLKRRRVGVNERLNEIVEAHTFDQINFVLREPTTDEIIQRDTQRNNYDPVEFTGYDEGEEYEDGEDVEDREEEEDAK